MIGDIGMYSTIHITSNNIISTSLESIPQLANNLTTTETGLALDATQGRALKNMITDQQVKVGSVAGKLYRNNVGGSGNFSISGNSGCIPNLTAGTFLIAIYAKSATQTYSFTFNFGTGNTYTLSTTNGELRDVRTITISSAATFSGSVSSGSVASGTILYIVLYNYLTPVTTVGPAAVTNRYADLDGTPSLATVATSGSYNDLSNKPAIPAMPTIGTLKTDNTAAQTPSSSESFSNSINLHKVSKTGSYNDLLDKPTITGGTVTSSAITDLTDIL